MTHYLIVSVGVTTKSASVIPAPNPAVKMRSQDKIGISEVRIASTYEQSTPALCSLHLPFSLTKHGSYSCSLSFTVLEQVPELVKGKEAHTCLGRCSNDECRKSCVDGSNALCPDCRH